MTNLSKIFGKTKAQIQKYLNNKLTKLRPTEKRCLSETFYGILESGNVTLSENVKLVDAFFFKLLF